MPTAARMRWSAGWTSRARPHAPADPPPTGLRVRRAGRLTQPNARRNAAMNPAVARRRLLRPLAFFALLAFLCTQPAGSRTPGAKAAPAADTADPLLQAMLQELERSKSQLKMENML